MDGIYILENVIQEYAWGSRTAIAELLGRPSPSPRTQAELWMGAHPKAPSRVLTDSGPVALDRFIEADPDAVLGPVAAHRFTGRLPYLFKVLAAAAPLSMQAHPDLEQARQGFARENREQIALDSPRRNYRDDNHKPECICALTDFWALNGFRERGEIARRLKLLCPATLGELIGDCLSKGAKDGLRRFFRSLMSLESGDGRQAVLEGLGNLHLLSADDADGFWIKALQKAYPGDIGVLSPTFLNLVRLRPGEAMYLPAGQLHAYLEGVGVELMANSDNVLRGGLSPKHVDVPELMRILNFKSSPLQILEPVPVSRSEKAYRTPAEEFELSVIHTDNTCPHTNHENTAVQILLCTEGRAVVSSEMKADSIPVRKGDCLLATAAAGPFQIEGTAAFYKAAVPGKV